MIAALVKVIRTKGLRRKWLWGVLAFSGLMSLRMNWASGQFDFQLLSVQLVGTGVMRQMTLFAPWMLNTTLPVGAVLILTGVWANPKRARRMEPSKPAAVDMDQTPDPVPEAP